jgi:phage tail protein X
MTIKERVMRENTTLDLLLWRLHGAAGAALLEDAYALNEGLAELGPVLPVGTELLLPELAPKPALKDVPVVTLFG